MVSASGPAWVRVFSFDQLMQFEPRVIQHSPYTLTSLQSIYTLRDAYRAHPSCSVTRQIEEWHRVGARSDENGNGQIELNLAPLVAAMADAVMRTRQVIFEVAQSMGLAASFMPQIRPGHANGMHIHHSLHDITREQ